MTEELLILAVVLEREYRKGKGTIRKFVDYFKGCYMSIFKHMMSAMIDLQRISI